MSFKWFIVGAAAGAAAMYVLDPNQGRTRRAEMQQRGAAAARRVGDQASVVAEQASDRVQGAAWEASRRVRDDTPADDVALADRVRSEVLGRPEYHDLSLNVDAVEGTVTLWGVVNEVERRRQIEREVGKISGVQRVESYLHGADEPAPNVALVV